MTPDPQPLTFPAALERVDWFAVIAAIRMREADAKREQRNWERNR